MMTGYPRITMGYCVMPSATTGSPMTFYTAYTCEYANYPTYSKFWMASLGATTSLPCSDKPRWARLKSNIKYWTLRCLMWLKKSTTERCYAGRSWTLYLRDCHGSTALCLSCALRGKIWSIWLRSQESASTPSITQFARRLKS